MAIDGRRALELHDSGLSWREVGIELDCKPTSARSAASRWKAKHPSEVLDRPDFSSDEEEAWIDEDLNTAIATSKTKRIKTLNQLLDECKVDLDTWKVDHWIANKWEVGAKDSDDNLVVKPLFQVKAWLVRKVLLPVFPVIQPVQSTLTYSTSVVTKRSGSLARSLVICDPHFAFSKRLSDAALTPFHDRRVLDIALQIGIDAKVDRVDWVGDILDLPDWTDRFLRMPEFYWTTQPAIFESHWWMGRYRHYLGDAEIDVYEGNHDKRMPDAIMKHLPAAYDLRAADNWEGLPVMSVPYLLGLEGLGVRWIPGYPDAYAWLNDRVGLEHGNVARGGAGDTAKAHAMASQHVIITAHIHRQELASRTLHQRYGRVVAQGFCPGCACHIDGRVPGKMGRQQWQQGIAIVEYEVDGTGYHLDPILIQDGTAVWQGHLYKAGDFTHELKQAYPEWNW